jgi:two-component system heavy metal sensor histidine kinase CusS
MKVLDRHRSLRQRLSWWLALQSFAGLGLVCLAVYLVTEFNFRDRQQDTLAQKETVIRHLLADGKEHRDSEDLSHKLDDFLVGHGDLSLEVLQADGVMLYAHTRNQTARTVWLQRQFEVAQVADPASKVLRVKLSLDIQTDNQLLHRLAVTLLVAAIGGAIVVSLGGFSLVNLGLAPVRRLASQTRALSVDSLHQRLDGGEQPLELVPLIDQFNALLARIEKAYSQMEGFNADVAHELCTPLATLIANNELALRRPEQADIREVFASNLEELHRLTGIVNDMLFLSRADRGVGARRAPVASLASVAADVLDYHEAALAEAGLTAKWWAMHKEPSTCRCCVEPCPISLGTRPDTQERGPSSKSISRPRMKTAWRSGSPTAESRSMRKFFRSCLIDSSAQILPAAMRKATMAWAWLLWAQSLACTKASQSHGQKVG